jgi:RNA polymerase sigma factor (sigma-70 family)
VREAARRTSVAGEAQVLVQSLAAGRAKLLAPLIRWLGSREDAEEVLHEAYVRALRTAGTIRHHHQALPWFQRLLRNAAIDHVRRLGTERRMRARWARDEGLARPFPQELHDWPCGCIVVALGQIRPSYADLLRRIELNEETVPRVARDLGMTANNIRVRLHRARAALRSRLREVCGPCMDARCLDCDCDPGRVARGLAKRANSGRAL